MPSKDVIVYTKKNCMPCNFTKNFLNDNNIDFQELNTTDHPDYIDDVKSMGFTSVPVILIKGEPAFNGFQPDRLATLIK